MGWSVSRARLSRSDLLGMDRRHSAKLETCANEGDEEMACFTGTWEVEDIQDDVSTLYADTAGAKS